MSVADLKSMRDQLRAELSAIEGTAPVMGIEDLKSQKASLQQELQQLQQPQEQELSFLQKASQIPRGMAGSVGSLVDLGLMALQGQNASGMKNMMSYLEPEQEAPTYIQPRVSETLKKPIDVLAGANLEPTTDMGKFRQGIGEFAVPLGKVKAVGQGVGHVAKAVGKNLLASTGASAGVHLTPRITEEGTIPGIAEDIVKAGVGAKAGLGIPGALQGAKETITHPLAKTASMFLKPKEDVLASAAKHGVKLPINVASDSKAANFVANNYLKSMFTSKQYTDSLKQADRSLMDSVKRQIDTLGEMAVKPSEGSQLYRQSLKEQEKALKKTSDVMYKNAEKLLSPEEHIKPTNTLSTLKSKPVEELLGSLSPSKNQQSVINRIQNIRQELGAGQVSAEVRAQFKNDPKMLATLLEAGLKQDVPVKKLIGLKSSLMNTLQYDPDVRGAEGFLSRIVKDLDKDISSIKNKEFLSAYKVANQFFKQNIGETFRESLGKSLISNKAPVEAYNLLNSVPNVRFLQKISGTDPKAIELFNALKKAKAEELMSSAITGGLESGTLRTGSFHQLFKKGKARNELLEELIGKKAYDNLTEIADISNEFAKSGRDLLNTSGTAHVLSDLNAGKDVAREVSKSLATLFGAASVGYGAANVPGAIAAVGSPYVVSRLAANPKFINQARAYAIARKAGKDKYSDTILKKMVAEAIVESNKYKKQELGKENPTAAHHLRGEE